MYLSQVELVAAIDAAFGLRTESASRREGWGCIQPQRDHPGKQSNSGHAVRDFCKAQNRTHQRCKCLWIIFHVTSVSSKRLVNRCGLKG